MRAGATCSSGPSTRPGWASTRKRPLHPGAVPHLLAHPLEGSEAAPATLGDTETGAWESAPGTDEDTETDEVFVVLAGRGTVTFDDGVVVELAPGVAVRLRAGERTTWAVTEPIRKVYVAL